MGDVLVKRREDQKKAKEALEKRKERHMKAQESAHGDTEMTPLNHTMNPSYVDPENETHETYYVHFAAQLFGVGTIDEEKKDNEHDKKKSDFAFNERISLHEWEEAEDDCLWTAMPDSIVALNLTLAATKDLTDNTWNYVRASVFCGILPLAMTFVIEFTAIMCLWEDNSDLRNSSAFCHQHPLLQLAVVAIFGLTLQAPLMDVMTEASIGLSGTKVCFDCEDGANLFLHGSGASAGAGREFVDVESKPLIIKEIRTSFVSWFVYWTAVILEFAVWALTLYVGVHYTLSQADASEIVQSAVAISFINEIDNMVYDAVASEPLKDFLAKAEYQVRRVCRAKCQVSSVKCQVCVYAMPCMFCVPCTNPPSLLLLPPAGTAYEEHGQDLLLLHHGPPLFADARAVLLGLHHRVGPAQLPLRSHHGRAPVRSWQRGGGGRGSLREGRQGPGRRLPDDRLVSVHSVYQCSSEMQHKGKLIPTVTQFRELPDELCRVEEVHATMTFSATLARDAEV